MKQRFISVVAFALIVSAGASYILYRLISAKFAAAAKPPANQIVVAARNLEVGAMLKDLDLRLAEWTGPLPKSAFSKLEDVVGRGVVAAIYENEPVLENRIAAKGAGAGLAATIPPGMRAVAVRVNEVVGVAGFVTPGMRVDVLISGNPPAQRANHLGTLSRTLLQNIEVLSAGQNIQKDAEGKPVSVPVVNLLVTPEQAEQLSLAGTETRIQLVLRNPLDTETAKTTGTAIAHLFSGTKPPPDTPKPAVRVATRPKPAPAPPVVAPVKVPESEKIVIPITVEVIHGAKRTEAKFKHEEKEKSSSEANQ